MFVLCVCVSLALSLSLSFLFLLTLLLFFWREDVSVAFFNEISVVRYLNPQTAFLPSEAFTGLLEERSPKKTTGAYSDYRQWKIPVKVRSLVGESAFDIVVHLRLQDPLTFHPWLFPFCFSLYLFWLYIQTSCQKKGMTSITACWIMTFYSLCWQVELKARIISGIAGFVSEHAPL